MPCDHTTSTSLVIADSPRDWGATSIAQVLAAAIDALHEAVEMRRAVRKNDPFNDQ